MRKVATDHWRRVANLIEESRKVPDKARRVVELTKETISSLQQSCQKANDSL